MGLKIGGSGRRPQSMMKKVGVIDSGKTSSKSKMSFDAQMMDSYNSNKEEFLYEMAKSVIKQGEKLSEKVDISELKVYKKMMSEFLREIVRGSSKFSRESFLDRRGRHRVYVTVKKINKKLEELTEEILKKERDHLKIVNSIEDIRGLVLDLVL